MKNQQLRSTDQKLKDYQRNQILSMSPVQLVTKVFDVAIVSCKKKDSVKATKAIVELISGLRFEFKEIAVSLFQLYQYCLEKIRQGEYNEAESILSGLRESWVEASSKN